MVDAWSSGKPGSKAASLDSSDDKVVDTSPPVGNDSATRLQVGSIGGRRGDVGHPPKGAYRAKLSRKIQVASAFWRTYLGIDAAAGTFESPISTAMATERFFQW